MKNGWSNEQGRCLFNSLSAEMRIPSSLQYKTHFSRQLNCRSLRCSWSIACRRCSNYIFILNFTPGFNGLGKDNYKMRRETFKLWDLVHLILETFRYSTHGIARPSAAMFFTMHDKCRDDFCIFLGPANKRWCYIVRLSLIGWAHTQNDPRKWVFFFHEEGFQLPVPSQLWEMTQNANIFLSFMK